MPDETPPDKALTVHHGTSALRLTNEDRMTVHGMIVAQLGEQGLTVTPAEFEYFIRVAELRGLNPLFREVHLIKDRNGRINVQTGIDGFRKLAEDTGEYLGQTEPTWGDPYPDDGPVVAWRGKPAYCRVGVYRRGWEHPLYGEAWLEEDGATRDEWVDGRKTGRVIANAQWASRPRTMLKKVAEARAIRAGFPRQTAGLYTDDELPGTAPALTAGTSPPESAPGAPEGSGDESEATWRPEEPPPGLQAVVQTAPDGIRTVRPTSVVSKKYLTADGPHDKLEVKTKVGNRNHLLMLFGELAVAVDALQLHEGETVSVEGGTVEEIEWAPDKPKKKEVWGATALSVLRDGAWISAAATVPSLGLEADPTPPATGGAPTTPPPDTNIGTTASGASTATPASPTEKEPITAANTPQPTMSGPDGEIATLTIQLSADVNFGTSKGRKIAVVRGGDIETGEVVQAVLVEDADTEGEVAAQLGSSAAPFLKAGDRATILGTWARGWLTITGIGKAGAK